MVKAKVNIETARKSYKPGETITEQLSEADLAYFKKRNFITVEDDVDVPTLDDEAEHDAETGEEGEESDVDGAIFRNEASLSRMNKEDIVKYAAGIGLNLNESMLKTDLINAVLNYTEEKMGEQA